MTAKTAPKRIEVTLTQPHTHAGRDRKPGDKIMVTARQRDFLIKRGKVEGTPSAGQADN